MYWTAPVLVGLRGQQDAEVLGGRRRPRVLMLCCRLGEKFRVLGEQALAVSRSGGERRKLGIVTGEGTVRRLILAASP